MVLTVLGLPIKIALSIKPWPVGGAEGDWLKLIFLLTNEGVIVASLFNKALTSTLENLFPFKFIAEAVELVVPKLLNIGIDRVVSCEFELIEKSVITVFSAGSEMDVNWLLL